MCFHAARFESRLDDRGALIIFHRQDRSLWNSELIRAGHSYLAEAAQGDALSEYHVEAAIAAEHCSAQDFASTRWEAIDRLYAVLEEMKDNPIISLNRAVLLSQTAGPESAIGKLLELAKHPRLQEYYLLHATLGELHDRMGNREAARHCYAAAIERTTSKTEKTFLMAKLEALASKR
jgi:RNA polymerase sigma-70 factor (ECF subfamily)